MNREVAAYLSLGSNMGNKLYYLMNALIEIDSLEGVRLTKVSSFYETEPWGYTDQDSFYNIAVEIRTGLLPFELLRKLQEIEIKLERKRKVKWGPRTIDIDIIFYDDLNINVPELKVPHPRYHQRKFVLSPLYEVYSKKERIVGFLNGDRSAISKIVPNILVSSCLLGEECTYRGDSNRRDILDVIDSVNYVRVCPEEEGGLDTPRDPAEIVGERVVSSLGKDVTWEFLRGAEISLKRAIESGCTLAIMKAKSPSCGADMIYDGTFSGTLVEGQGKTVELLRENKIDVIGL